MNARHTDEGSIGMLDFVGRVTASATHEIKNELAVINEQSRLLQEMLVMAREGRQVDPGRMEELIGRVVARVGQADQAVRRLNAFAHSADLERTSSNPEQVLEALLRLFTRIASLKGVVLDFNPGQAGGEIALRPILFEQAVWICLDSVVQQAEKGNKLKVSLKLAQDALMVIFQLEPSVSLRPPDKELLCLPGAEVRAAPDGGLLLEARFE